MNNVVSVADTSAWVLRMVMVSKAVPPALMALGEKVFETMGSDGETGSASAAVQVPAMQESAEFVLVTLAGGEMIAVLVTPC